jgi:hypothetical protein
MTKDAEALVQVSVESPWSSRDRKTASSCGEGAFTDSGGFAAVGVAGGGMPWW